MTRLHAEEAYRHTDEEEQGITNSSGTAGKHGFSSGGALEPSAREGIGAFGERGHWSLR